MNNKGFTLVELLASIVILAIVLAIAVPAISNLSTTIRRNHLENTIENIEIAASKYAFDTKETLVFVDKLVKEGYMEGDNKDDIVYDRLNNKKLNCYLVKMEKTSAYYKAKFQNDRAYEINGKCDESILNELGGDVSIQVFNNGVEIKNLGTWLKGNVTLKAVSKNLSLDCTKYQCNWTSKSGSNKNGLEINISNIVGVLNTMYTFQYKIINNDGHINNYESILNLKIDNEAPDIYIDETEKSITDRYITNVSKRLNIVASDKAGSGIAGYYLELDNGEDCNTVNNYIDNNEFTISATPTSNSYLICVRDNVGNVASGHIVI